MIGGETMEREATQSERPRRVLLVDDESSIRDCLSEFLLHKGFKVDPASDCLDALVEAMTKSHDCLVLDLNFPDINGVFLFHQIKRINRELAERTIFITGLDERHPTHQRALETGVPVLAKPFDFSRLSDILDGYCEST